MTEGESSAGAGAGQASSQLPDLDSLESVPDAELSSLSTYGQSSAPRVAAPKLESYNPEPGRDNVRKYIAYWLLGILSFIVVACVYLLYNHGAVDLKIEDIRTLVELLFTPVVTLLGAVTGFYYATHAKGDRQ